MSEDLKQFTLTPIANFVMNGTEVLKEPALPPMGKLSGHTLYLVGTAPSKAVDMPYNEPVRLDSYKDAMKLLNTDNAYLGTLPSVVEYILTRVDVNTYVIVVPEGQEPSIDPEPPTEDGGQVLEAPLVAPTTLDNVIGGVDAETGQATGIYKIPEGAEQPTIVYCPSFSDLGLGQKLSQIASEVEAIPVLDCPDTTKLAAAQFRSQFGGLDTAEENLCLAFPAGLYDLNNGAGETIIPAGARLVAGLADVQLWESPQNALDGCKANTVPVGYNPTRENSDHNYLNKYGVFTFCNSPAGGIRVMGNRCQSGKFSSKAGLEIALSVKLVQTSELYKGKMMTLPFVESIVARLNSWIKTLKIDDKCIIDAKVVVSSKNSADSYRSGSFYIGINYGEYTPLEHFQVTLAEDLTIVEKYVEELKKL